nr:hypothetical protein [Tanacetum cinerariifolium]
GKDSDEDDDEDDDDDDEEEETAKDDKETKETGKGGDEGRGLQITQSVEDTHVILTPLNPDDPQESSSVTPLFVKKTLCHNLGVSSKHS